MKRALDLSGKSPATKESYLRSARQLADYLQKEPEEAEEQELERYLLYRRNESRWKPATLRLCYAGIKFYFQTVLDRRWKLFSILHAEDQRTLPVVLTQYEVTRILSCVKTFHNYVFLSLVYACGLRLGETLALSTCSCDECGRLFDIYRSCGNRHCPICGKAKGREWLEKQLDRLLPVPHFMITFTVPAAFRSLFLAHRKLCYQAFFQASLAVLSRLGSESTYFPGDAPGFFGVLHSWGRNLSYHPHIHYIVSAGAFDSRTHRRHDCPTAFYAPVRILSKLVKARFFALIEKTGLLEELPAGAFEKDWNVDSRPVGTGVRALRYLSAYVFRTAISDKRIVSVDEDTVTFAYTDTKTGMEKLMSHKPFEFMRRFLEHVLPKGFMKIRYFGFLHPSSSIPVKLAVVHRTEARSKTGAPFCPCCSGSGHVLSFSPPAARVHSGFT